MSSLPGQAAEQDKPLNLLFVFTDQQRVHALGFWNTPGFKLDTAGDPALTPNLDRFARESLVLTHAVSSHPVCSPYRASFMTGQYSFKNRVHWNCTSQTEPMGNELPKDARCWSDVLKDKGYSLGYIGKWHLDSPRPPYVDCYNNRGKTKWNEWCSPDRRHGFDFWHSYGTFDHHMDPLYWPTDAPRDGFIRPGKWGPEHETDTAIAYIRNEGGAYRKADRPFALAISMNPPHTPYRQVPEKYVAQYEGKTWRDLINRDSIDVNADTPVVKGGKNDIKHYLAMVTGVDEQFGRLLKCLDDEGLARNTVVIFTSDHGNCLGAHGHATKNVHYDESLRVPFLCRLPARIAPRVDNLLFGAADVMPTFLGLLGFGSDVPVDVDGKDFSPLFLGRQMTRPSGALYLKPARGNPAYGERGVRTHRYTLVVSRQPDKPDKWILHDNESDPYQLEDIATASPDLAKTIYDQELVPLLKAYNDPWLGLSTGRPHP